MLKALILQGRIPYFMQIKQVMLWLGIVTPFYIFFVPGEFTEFAEIGWHVLTFVMVIRPLADIFPEIRLLRTLAMLRKELGIFAGMMILAHFSGYVIVNKVNVLEVFGSGYWGFDNYLTWGLLGLLVMLPVLVSSNKSSMKLLGRWWRRIQKLSYLIFFFGGIHIVLIGGELSTLAFYELICVAVLWVVAKFKFKIKFAGSRNVE